MAEAVEAVQNAAASCIDDPEYWLAHEKKLADKERALIEKARSNRVLKGLNWETQADVQRAFAAVGRFFVERMTVEELTREMMRS